VDAKEPIAHHHLREQGTESGHAYGGRKNRARMRDENGFAGEGTGLRIVHQGLGVVEFEEHQGQRLGRAVSRQRGGAPADQKGRLRPLDEWRSHQWKARGIRDGKAVFQFNERSRRRTTRTRAEVDLLPGSQSGVTRSADAVDIYFATRGRLTLVSTAGMGTP